MKVRSPVIVAEGIDGKPFLVAGDSEPSVRLRRFHTFDRIDAIKLGFLCSALVPSDANKERNALTEAINTLTQPSSCCRKSSNGTSWISLCLGVTMVLTRPITIMDMLKHRDRRSQNFCRGLILAFQSRITGMLMTEGVSSCPRWWTGPNLLMKSVNTSNPMTVAKIG